VKGWRADEFTQRLEKLFAGDVRPPAISFLP
jgi:hypothetical protein